MSIVMVISVLETTECVPLIRNLFCLLVLELKSKDLIKYGVHKNMLHSVVRVDICFCGFPVSLLLTISSTMVVVCEHLQLVRVSKNMGHALKLKWKFKAQLKKNYKKKKKKESCFISRINIVQISANQMVNGGLFEKYISCILSCSCQ